MRKVAIIGVGITPFRARYLDKTYFELLPPPVITADFPSNRFILSILF